MLIPKVLHQTWKTKELPAPFDAYRRSWQRLHPDWEFPLYDDADCRSFVASSFPQLLALYDGLPTNIQRADVFRYLVVYKLGGVYADVDMECWKCIEPLLEGRACVFATEATFGRHLQRKLGYRHPYQVANCIFAAAPHDPFLKFAIDHLRAADPANFVAGRRAVEETTGPRFLTRLLQEHRELFPDFVLLPQIHWMPPTRPTYPNLFPFNVHIYCKHHFAGTWTGIYSGGDEPTTFKERYAQRWHHPAPWFRHDFEPTRLVAHFARRLRAAFATRVVSATLPNARKRPAARTAR